LKWVANQREVSTLGHHLLDEPVLETAGVLGLVDEHIPVRILKRGRCACVHIKKLERKQEHGRVVDGPLSM